MGEQGTGKETHAVARASAKGQIVDSARCHSSEVVRLQIPLCGDDNLRCAMKEEEIAVEGG